MQRYRLPRLHDLLFIALFAGCFALGARMLNTDSDLGRHLTLGGYILRSGHIPTQDILSYTRAGAARPPYEWLSQVLFAMAFRLLGLDGVVLLTAFVIAAAFSLVFLDAASRSGAPVFSLLLTAWAAAASSLHWITRPHVFSFLIFAVWVAMLDRVRRGERQPLWQFPLLMAVWANIHGGFVFGFLAFAAYLAGWLAELRRPAAGGWTGRKLLAVGVASLAASAVTPDLWHNWDAVLGNRSAYVLSRTAETMPLDPRLANTWGFLVLAALSGLLIALCIRRVAAAHVLLLAGLAATSFLMARNVPFFAIAAAPLCSAWLARSLSQVPPWAKVEEGFGNIDRSLQGFLWSGLAVVLACGVLVYHRSQVQAGFYSIDPARFPVDAANWLERHPPPAHMFNDFNWGGYLLLRTWPEQRVFVDSQSDFYGEAFIREYAAILDATPDWEAELAKYQVSWLIVPPAAPLAVEARRSPAWNVAYEDPVAIILVRR